jgi:glutamate-1-semialdehyde 2,1-aminomutase
MKLDKSRELYERSRKSLAGGVSSNVRLSEKPVPLFFQRAKGSRLYDVDGNEYIDYVLGQGPDVFGHAPDFLLEAVTRGMRNGQVFAGQHELEIRVSEAIQRLVPSAELVRYASSGTEVVQAALRVARAYTARPKFIKFEGHYHGWMDSVYYSMSPSLEQAGAYDAPNSVPMSAGMAPGTADEVIILPWNDVEVLRAAVERHGDQVAAIITEPILCNTNCIMPRPGYLEEMRRLCDERGILLIFDEVITGFRVALGGAQELFGVTPDLSTFAKAVAGGFPLAMLAGKREMMGLIADGTVMHGGTVNSNVMVMAAAEAALQMLTENDGAAYKQLYSTGAALMEGLSERARKHEIELLIQGPGPCFFTTFTNASEITDYRSHRSNADEAAYARFHDAMLERGVRLTSRGLWFVSTAHTPQDVEQTLESADQAFASM